MAKSSPKPGLNVRFVGAMPASTAPMENADGMEPFVTIPASELTAAQRQFLRDAIKGLFSPDALLDWITALADAHAADDDRGIRGEASILRFEAEHLRSLPADARAAAIRGIKLGMMAAQFNARLAFDGHVKHSTASRRGRARARETHSDNAKQRYDEIRDHVAARLAGHPKDSLTYARKTVADKLGLSLDTVKRATKGLKKIRK